MGDQWTHTTAPSGSTCPGTLPSRLGVAPTRARDALHPLEDVLRLLPDSCSRIASALAMHHLPAPLACRAHAMARLPGTAMQRSAPAFAPSSGADCRFCFQLAVQK